MTDSYCIGHNLIQTLLQQNIQLANVLKVTEKKQVNVIDSAKKIEKKLVFFPKK